MEQAQQPNEVADSDALSESQSSERLGGGRQVEQEPVRGRRMGDHPAARADTDIRADLDAQLAAVDDFDPEVVELVVSDGIVVMLGAVADYPTKRRLEDLAARVRGVREIHDQLQVTGEGSSQTSDGLRMEAPGAGPRSGDS